MSPAGERGSGRARDGRFVRLSSLKIKEKKNKTDSVGVTSNGATSKARASVSVRAALLPPVVSIGIGCVRASVT